MKVLGIGSVFNIGGKDYTALKITKECLICNGRAFTFDEINLAYDNGSLVVKEIQ